MCFEERYDDARRKPALILFEKLFGRLVSHDMIPQRHSVLRAMKKSFAPFNALLDEDLKKIPGEIMRLIKAQNRERDEDDQLEGSF